MLTCQHFGLDPLTSSRGVTWGCRMGCSDTNKKQITESVSNPRDEFINYRISGKPRSP
jgi:hypothetical protein